MRCDKNMFEIWWPEVHFNLFVTKKYSGCLICLNCRWTDDFHSTQNTLKPLERYFLLDVNEGITSAAKLRTYWTGVMFNFTLKWHVMLSLSMLSRLDDLRHAHQSNFSQQLTRFICWGFLNERHGCIFIKNLPTGLKLCKRSPDYLTCGP